MDLKMESKMKRFNEHVTCESVGPSAPPCLACESPSESVTSSDNNIDAPSDEDQDDGYSHHVVSVDVHQGSSRPRSLVQRHRQFSFTDSILEEIEGETSPSIPRHSTK